MEIVNIVGLGIIGSMLIVVLKVEKPEISTLLSVLIGIAIFFIIAGKIAAVITLVNSYAKKIDIDIVYFSTLFKIIGIAYITEFGAQVCKDAGVGAIASKIELAGKVIIVALAVPIITSLLDLIVKIMP